MSAARKFERGEARELSVKIIQKNIKAPYEKLVAEVSKALGMPVTQASGHIKWLRRVGIVSVPKAVAEKWPARIVPSTMSVIGKSKSSPKRKSASTKSKAKASPTAATPAAQ